MSRVDRSGFRPVPGAVPIAALSGALGPVETRPDAAPRNLQPMEELREIRSEDPSPDFRAGLQTSLISLAFLTGMVLVPVVVAVGLLTDGDTPRELPSSVAEAPLRGTFAAAGQLGAPAPAGLPLPRRAAY